MDKQKMKEAACRKVDELQPLIYEIADYIHAHPELGGSEYLASSYLRKVLGAAGFTVEDIVPEAFPTAFHASWGDGPFHMGFLAEYDALPEIGHGCGHNLIAAMSVGAALAFAAVCGAGATVHVYGCPAEETAGSKVYMSDQGVFDELDATVILHPCADTTSIGGTSYASHPMEFTFLGKAAHIADREYEGINALDALVDFYRQLKDLEQTWTETHLIGAIITDGGIAPNIVPDKAVMRATIRALDAQYLETVMLPQIRELAQAVAQAHGAEVAMVHYEPLYKNMIQDAKINVYFAEAFNALHEPFDVKDDDYADGSSDVGNVSQVTRACQPEICICYDAAAHTEKFAAAAGGELGKMQALVGAKAMAMVAVEVMNEKNGKEFLL